MDLLELSNKELWNKYYQYLSEADALWDKQEKPLLMRHLYAHVLEIINELQNRGIYNEEDRRNVNTRRME